MKTARLKARLSKNALAGLAGVASDTVDRAEKGLPVQEVKAYAIIEALNDRLPPGVEKLTLADVAIYEKE